MKVRLCSICPFEPEDLGETFSPTAEDYCCFDCPERHRHLGPRTVRRRALSRARRARSLLQTSTDLARQTLARYEHG